MKARAFSSGSSLLLEAGKRCGNAVASRWAQFSGRSQPHNVALPAWGESCWAVKAMAMAWPWLLNSKAPATVW